ncbi:FG-GAP repeat domain-containing protein [Streptomyces zhihengii]
MIIGRRRYALGARSWPPPSRPSWPRRPAAPSPRPVRAGPRVDTPSFSMKGVDRETAEPYLYFTDREGGFEPREHVAVGYGTFADSIDVDDDGDGWSDGTWNLYEDGTLDHSWIDDRLAYHSEQVGTGWDVYTSVLSPGTSGAPRGRPRRPRQEGRPVAAPGPPGRLPHRTHPRRRRLGRLHPARRPGDLTGDGRPDIVARDTAGVLWLHPGTGDRKAPFAPRTRIGGGWNAYDRLLSVGDLDADGRADLIAREPDGDLYRYSGTGTAPGSGRSRSGSAPASRSTTCCSAARHRPAERHDYFARIRTPHTRGGKQPRPEEGR